jgi:hypothetical protein
MTQQGQLDRLHDAVRAQGAKIKGEWGNADGSITVHVVPPDGRGVMAFLVKTNGTATKSWHVSPRESDRGVGLKRQNTSRRKWKKEFRKQGLFGPGTEAAPKQSKRRAHLRKLGVYSEVPRRERKVSNPTVLRNMASVTIKRLPGGAVAITGRRMKGGKR